MIVVDASVVVKWFVREAGHDQYLAAVRDERLVAPDRMLLEVANVLRRKARHGEISVNQGALAVERLPGLIDAVVPSAELLLDAYELSEALDHSVYDCAYLACARHLKARLLTADARFASKIAATDLAIHLHDAIKTIQS